MVNNMVSRWSKPFKFHGQKTPSLAQFSCQKVGRYGADESGMDPGMDG